MKAIESLSMCSGFIDRLKSGRPARILCVCVLCLGMIAALSLFFRIVIARSPSPEGTLPAAKHEKMVKPAAQVSDSINLPGLPKSLVPQPPPAAPLQHLEQSLQVVDMGDWKPVVVGITPDGWNVAPDPERELEYSGPGIRVRVPVYRIIPKPGSIYIIEPGRESGFDIPQTLASSADKMEKEAEIFEATANALAELLPKDLPAKDPKAKPVK